MIQRADRASVAALIDKGVAFEPVVAELERVFELDGQIVAASAACTARIAPPRYQPEPIGPLDRATEPGPHLAVIGSGLVVTPDLDPSTAGRVHRLARTLASQEIGARYGVITAPLFTLPPFEPGGIVQQIAAGSVQHLPVRIPLTEGYWPIGTIEYTVVMVRRNDAF